MSGVQTIRPVSAITVCLLVASCFTQSFALPQSTSVAQAAPADHAASSPLKTSSAGAPSASDIAAAKAAGKVWVNLNSGVYHKGGRWYGKTKDGKFMMEDEAKKAGYKPAHRD